MTIERHPVQPRTAEWHALRRQDLTASDLGAVAGIDPWRTSYAVWAQKAGLADGPAENEAMKIGRWLEPAVVCALGEVHPEWQIQYPLCLYIRDADLRLGGTPDGLDAFDHDPVYEFKVISEASHAEWQDGPPLRYQLQTLANAMLLDVSHGVLAALVLGWQRAELVVHRIERHAGAEQKIRDIASRFWAAFDEGHALAGPDYERDIDTIRQVMRPRKDRPAPIDLSGNNRIRDLLEERDTALAIVRAEEKHAEICKAEIITALNGAEAAVLPGWKISHTMTHRDAYMVEAKDYPQLRATRTKERSP